VMYRAFCCHHMYTLSQILDCSMPLSERLLTDRLALRLLAYCWQLKFAFLQAGEEADWHVGNALHMQH